MHYKFLIERWVNRRRFIIDNRNWQKFGLRGELIYVYSHYIIILSFQSQFLVLQLVK